MDSAKMLENSNLLVIQAVDGFPETGWDIPGACGEWSVKDIVAHLTSYEHVIAGVLGTFMGNALPATVMQWINQSDTFNASEVESRKYLTAQQVIDEYQNMQVETASTLMQIPPENVQQVGTMPWYHKNCCLADFIQQVYEHTREHCAQIALFRANIKAEIENDPSAT